MKTPDEIKRWLGMCHCDYAECDTCSLADLCEEKAQGLAYIKQLERDNAQKDERIQQLERERDAAVKDMHEAQGCLCLICKNFAPAQSGEKKYTCKAFGNHVFESEPLMCGQFEWRGVKEDDE